MKFFWILLFLPTALVAQTFDHPNHIHNAPPVFNDINFKEGYDLVRSWEFDNDDPAPHTTWRNDFEVRNNVRVFPQDMDRYILTNRSENVSHASVTHGSETLDVLRLRTIKENPLYNSNVWFGAGKETEEYPDHDNGGAGYDFPMTSGQVRSNDHFLYGYFEVRARLNEGSRMWPAFWLYGQFEDDRIGGTTNKLEFDIFEIFPDQHGRNQIKANVHYDTPNAHRSLQNIYKWGPVEERLIDDITQSDLNPMVVDEKKFYEEFNTWGFEWGPDKLIWYYNNQEFLRITDPTLIERFIRPMNVRLNTEVDHRGGDWETILETINAQSDFEIDYVRVYKKQPEIVPVSNSCSTGTFVFAVGSEFEGLTVPQDADMNCRITSITYEWTISDPTVASFAPGFSGTEEQIEVVMNPGFEGSKFDLTLTERVNYEAHPNLANHDDYTLESSKTIIVPTIDPGFDLSPVSCVNGSLEVTASALVDLPCQGDGWYLYECDENGVIPSGTTPAIEYGPVATFNNLVDDQWYSLKHGTYGSPYNWRSTIKVFHVEAATSSGPQIICEGWPGARVEIATTNSGIDNGWYLYELVEGELNHLSTEHGMAATFTGLELEKEYEIKHGAYNGGCNLDWTEDRYRFRIPSFDLDPTIRMANVLYRDVQNDGMTLDITFESLYPDGSHYWVLNDVNQSDPLNDQDPEFMPFHPQENSTPAIQNGGTEFTVNNMGHSRYYVLKHGMWSECALWSERRYLIKIPLFTSQASSYKVDGTSGEQIVIEEITPELTLEERIALTEQYEQVELVQPALEVFPNPTSDYIEFRLSDMDVSSRVDIQIFDATGGIVAEDFGVMLGDWMFDTRDLSGGIYTLSVYEDGQRLSEKFVIE